jgi:hypothetical protein
MSGRGVDYLVVLCIATHERTVQVAKGLCPNTVHLHLCRRVRVLQPRTHIIPPSPPPIMPLEATMMIIDNSEFMRNGDYQPSRFDAQADAVNTVFQTKIDANPENMVGIMTMAGKG